MNPNSRPTDGTARRGHVLLLSPLTFSYHESICSSLRELGYEVTWWNDRASSSTRYKLALRMLPWLTRRWSTRHYMARLRALPLQEVTNVLVIKGEGLSRRFVQALRAALPDVPMGYYLWDGVDNVKGTEDIVDCFDAVASFDPVDAMRFGWRHRPLFSRNPRAHDPDGGKDLDWCFIGTLHSDRHRVIHRLERSGRASMSSFVFCYSPSRAMLWTRHLTDWTLWLAKRETLSTVAMPAAQVQAIVARARAVLDIEHPLQRGLTMRTIETVVAGHKLVTTNRLVVESDLYHPSRIHVISRDDPRIPADFLNQDFEPLSNELFQRYSCAGWVQELLDQAAEARESARVP